MQNKMNEKNIIYSAIFERKKLEANTIAVSELIRFSKCFRCLQTSFPLVYDEMSIIFCMLFFLSFQFISVVILRATSACMCERWLMFRSLKRICRCIQALIQAHDTFDSSSLKMWRFACSCAVVQRRTVKTLQTNEHKLCPRLMKFIYFSVIFRSKKQSKVYFFLWVQEIFDNK